MGSAIELASGMDAKDSPAPFADSLEWDGNWGDFSLYDRADLLNLWLGWVENQEGEDWYGDTVPALPALSQ